ncbi:MAG: manganese efflux pump [Nitrospirota bacterium]
MNDLHLLSIMLLSISASIDNFGAGISYGLRNVCLPLSLNLFIAFLNSSGTFVSMLSGREFSGLMKPRTAGYLGALLLIGIGASIVVMEFRKKVSEGLLTGLVPPRWLPVS